MARPGEFFSDRTAWVRRLQTPLRQFLRTESGGAAVLLAAAVAALVWVHLALRWASRRSRWTGGGWGVGGRHGIKEPRNTEANLRIVLGER